MVFILPEDLSLTSGSPRHQRNFLDIYLSQFSRSYLSNLMDYQHILKQRNALLKLMKEGEKQSGAAELDTWDDNLLSVALKIMKSRKKFIGEIEDAVTGIAFKISGSKEDVKISYRPKIEIENFEDLKAALHFFRQYRIREKRIGTTLIGPHRDSLDIILDDKPLREFGSLGQKKTVMIAMKLAVLDVMSEHLGERAILLLDEAFAEFDGSRTKSLLGLLSDSGQVFLANADEIGLGELHDNVQVFDVDSGNVTER